MDEYSEVVKRFYEVYLPLGRKYNLSIHSTFKTGKLGIIRIYQGDWPRQKQIIKVERDGDVDCYKKAIDELESWARNQQKETVKYKTA